MRNKKCNKGRFFNVTVVGALDSVMLLVALFFGDFVLLMLNDIPIAIRDSLVMIPVWILLARAYGLYPGWGYSVPVLLQKIFHVLSVLFVMAISALFLAGETKSRIMITVAYLISLVLIPLGRVISISILIKLKKWGAPVAIYGSADRVIEINEILKKDVAVGYVPKMIFSDDSIDPSICDLPVKGRFEDFTDDVKIAVVCSEQRDYLKFKSHLENLVNHYRTVLMVPDLQGAPSVWVKPRDLQGVLGLEISHNLLKPVSRFIKRFFEFSFVFVSAIFWAPVVGILALLIWLSDRGNPFFLQERIGFEGKPFKTYKLRTMVPNAEAVLQKALNENAELKAEWEATCKLKKDPRITAVGNFLRITSLDELPQLINVFKGDMAIVGPRPLPKYHYDQLTINTQKLRERVLPGVTGMWQVSGRSDSGNKGFERWDSYYVMNWSIWLDIFIIFKTVGVVLKRDGAY